MTKVNFGFISDLEGGPRLTGYVPDSQLSNSGITIATGFDLGQRSVQDLQRLLPHSLVVKLNLYCGLKRQAALSVLRQKPLVIDEDEACAMDLCAKSQLLEQLTERYNRASTVPFNQLPEHCQTVIASVAFQYGNLATRCPNLWALAIAQNWPAMDAELCNFGDRYPTRRKREANYLRLRS